MQGVGIEWNGVGGQWREDHMPPSLSFFPLFVLLLVQLFPICVSNSDSTIYKGKKTNMDLKTLRSSSIKQHICFCPKETDASSPSTERNTNRLSLTHHTLCTSLNLTWALSAQLRAVTTALLLRSSVHCLLQGQRATWLLSPCTHCSTLRTSSPPSFT